MLEERFISNFRACQSVKLIQEMSGAIGGGGNAAGDEVSEISENRASDCI